MDMIYEIRRRYLVQKQTITAIATMGRHRLSLCFHLEFPKIERYRGHSLLWAESRVSILINSRLAAYAYIQQETSNL